MKNVVDIATNRKEVSSKLNKLIENVSNERIAKQGHFNIGVSGGSLVGFLKEGLPNLQTDFNKWRIFFCDERVVPEDSTDSTYGQYKELINLINLKESQFVKIKQGISATEAAEEYAQQMTLYFSKESLPKFDMLLLGMGPDGHTCSLFPGNAVLEEKSKWVAPILNSPKPPPARITLTFPVINNALYCVFVVCGREKADMIKKVMAGQVDLPASRVQPRNGNLVWILDEEAGKYVKA